MRLWSLFVLSSLALTVAANPILVRWDEFAICLRRRLKRQFSPNVICATRKMASNFRRSVRCPGCEKYFHCQANYEAVFHCSQAPEAIQTAEVFSDCREYATLGGPAAGSLSDRQEANMIGRRGGDCVGEFLTKGPNFSLASIFNLGAPRKCQWNPFENTCGSAASEVIASADYPPLPTTTEKPYAYHDSSHSNSVGGPPQSPFSLASLINLTQPLLNLPIKKPVGAEKAPSLMETLQTLNNIKNKFSSLSAENGSPPVIRPEDDSEKNIIPLTTPVTETKPSRIPIVNSDSAGENLQTTVQDDPLFGSIASAFGSFFGKPPVIGRDENSTTPAAIPILQQSSQQRPSPILIPLNGESIANPVHHGSSDSVFQSFPLQRPTSSQAPPGSSGMKFIFPSSRNSM